VKASGLRCSRAWAPDVSARTSRGDPAPVGSRGGRPFGEPAWRPTSSPAARDPTCGSAPPTGAQVLRCSFWRDGDLWEVDHYAAGPPRRISAMCALPRLAPSLEGAPRRRPTPRVCHRECSALRLRRIPRQLRRFTYALNSVFGGDPERFKPRSTWRTANSSSRSSSRPETGILVSASSSCSSNGSASRALSRPRSASPSSSTRVHASRSSGRSLASLIDGAVTRATIADVLRTGGVLPSSAGIAVQRRARAAVEVARRPHGEGPRSSRSASRRRRRTRVEAGSPGPGSTGAAAVARARRYSTASRTTPAGLALAVAVSAPSRRSTGS